MTLFHRTVEEMIQARHMVVLILSASQAVTESLEIVQKLHVQARPASGAYSSTSVCERMWFVVPDPGRENGDGCSRNRCFLLPAWLSWRLMLF